MNATISRRAFAIMAMAALLMGALTAPSAGNTRRTNTQDTTRVSASETTAGPSCRKCKKVVRRAKRCKRQGNTSPRCKRAQRQAKKCRKILRSPKCRRPGGGGGGGGTVPTEACPAGQTCMWLHGTNPDGDAEAAEHTANGTYMQMDPTKPTEPVASKSRQITNYGAGPNTQCAGNNLFPVWQGKMAGTITGDMVFTFHAVTSPPTEVKVQVWPDINALSCNESYPKPARETTVELPAGQSEIKAVIKGADIKAVGSVMVQITPILATEGGTPFEGRVFYDAENALSVLAFACTPAAGTSSCTQ